MKRTLVEIRCNMPLFGCDNATALEMCDRIEALEAALCDSACPRPVNSRPDSCTVAECMLALECGCDLGVVLGREVP